MRWRPKRILLEAPIFSHDGIICSSLVVVKREAHASFTSSTRDDDAQELLREDSLRVVPSLFLSPEHRARRRPFPAPDFWCYLRSDASSSLTTPSFPPNSLDIQSHRIYPGLQRAFLFTILFILPPLSAAVFSRLLRLGRASTHLECPLLNAVSSRGAGSLRPLSVLAHPAIPHYYAIFAFCGLDTSGLGNPAIPRVMANRSPDRLNPNLPLGKTLGNLRPFPANQTLGMTDFSVDSRSIIPACLLLFWLKFGELTVALTLLPNFHLSHEVLVEMVHGTSSEQQVALYPNFTT
ncbi:hypothetical protein C8J57DRAFT_1533903 [Mycena rebaudengoi]|nr:hypothetical protein C8J57DRAFT_1533903 [Mycena rebaudengoi]